jgi:hypothetical protein
MRRSSSTIVTGRREEGSQMASATRLGFPRISGRETAEKIISRNDKEVLELLG